MAGIKNYAGVSSDLDVATKRYVDDWLSAKAAKSDMDSLVSGLDDAILLLDGWNGVFAESWTLTMSNGTTQTRVVLNRQEESNG